MAGKFEEDPGGLFTFSEAALRIGIYKCTWMAFTSVQYGALAFSVTFLVFQVIFLLSQITPPFTFSWNPDRDWLLHHSLLLGSEITLLGGVAFITLLVPTLIMTWITALVFQYLFGRDFIGRRERLVAEGSSIAKDIMWVAFKSMLKKANIAATFVLIFALLAFNMNGRKNYAEL
jgi:hypothetical protein